MKTTPKTPIDRDPLFADVKRLQPTKAQLDAAWRRVQGAPPHRMRWRMAASGGFALAAAVALVVWLIRPPGVVPNDETSLVVASGATEVVPGLANATVRVMGPGRVLARVDRLTLVSGALIAATTAPLVVEAGGRRYHLPAGAVVEIRVMQSHVSIAAYVGEVEIETPGRVRARVPVGQRLDGETLTSIVAAPQALAPPSEMSTPAAAYAAASAPPPSAPPPAPPRSPLRTPPRLAPHESIAPAKPAVVAEPAAPPVIAVPTAPSVSAPAPVAPPPSEPVAPLPIQREAELLATAQRQMRAHDSLGALATLDRLRVAAPESVLAEEARLVRIEAYLARHQRSDARRELDLLASRLLHHDLRLLRAELRTEEGSAATALDDYAVVLADDATLHEGTRERAWWGRAVAQLRLGQKDSAGRSFRDYLRLFPSGKHAAEAAAALAAIETRKASH